MVDGSLKIGGVVSLAVNDDPSRIVSFNPSDTGFVERLFGMLDELEKKTKENETKINALISGESESVQKLSPQKRDELKIKLSKELADYFREKIDELFGAGTSQMVFGDYRSHLMIFDFFTGISEYVEGYQKDQSQRLSKYAKKVQSAKTMR
jgi:hypothetical protein